MPIEHAPTSWQPALYRVRAWALRDGAMMAAAGVHAFILGLSYFGVFGPYQPRIHPIEELTAWWLWAGMWCVAGVGMIFAGFTPHPRVRTWIFTGYTALMLTWATSYFVGWVTGELDRGVAMSLLYALVPALMAWAVWRGSRTELVVMGGGPRATDRATR